ncbi:cytochrome p450, putative, partial [Perkinsus marinus ATCC 50983]
VFSTPYVVTQKPETIRQLMKDRVKGYHMRQFNSLNLLPRSGVFLSEGDHWRLNRKAAEPALSESSADSMVPIMTQMAKRMVNIVSTLADPSGIIDNWVPHQWFRRCTLDFTVATHFGEDYNLQNTLDMRRDKEREIAHKAVQGWMDAIDYVFKHIYLAPIMQDRYPFKLNRSVAEFYSCKKAVVQYSEKIINERTAELKAGATPKTNVLDKLLNMHKGDLTWNLVTFILAGSASASATMEWFVYLMPENWFLPGTTEINRDLARDHWAFSCGPRKCPGQTLAVKECTIIAAFLLRHFDDIRFTLGYDDVKETMWLNRVPENLRVTMSLRNY